MADDEVRSYQIRTVRSMVRTPSGSGVIAGRIVVGRGAVWWV